MDFKDITCSLLEQIKAKKPIIHHITNYVTVNDCANVTLAMGGSPIMADDLEEVEEIAGIANALVINIGTLNVNTIESMVAAGQMANQRNIPVIFDPVGAGASSLRNHAIDKIMENVRFKIIRGNISEIMYIAGYGSYAKGVDAAEKDINGDVEAAKVAKELASKLQCGVIVSGQVDAVSNGERTLLIENGHRLLSTVSGTGCMCNSLAACFSSVTVDSLTAAYSAMLVMGIAGELAFLSVGSKGTGSYHRALLDEISKISTESLIERSKIYEV